MTVTNDSNFHIAYKVKECCVDLLQLNAIKNHEANIQNCLRLINNKQNCILKTIVQIYKSSKIPCETRLKHHRTT